MAQSEPGMSRRFRDLLCEGSFRPMVEGQDVAVKGREAPAPCLRRSSVMGWQARGCVKLPGLLAYPSNLPINDGLIWVRERARIDGALEPAQAAE
jgi:hypothetical protein